ncbi:MAG: DNA polymerase III subunit psi [Bacteroidota bacterium]
MERDNLHLLLNEELYLIDKTTHNTKITDPKDVRISVANQAKNIGEEYGEDQKIIGLAIFHESNKKEELQLLEKIIAACKLKKEQYQVFSTGLDTSIKFEKALVFATSSETHYQPFEDNGQQKLYAAPLSEIMNNRSEKAKLWDALQVYLASGS